jgi:sugar/nucleoside kinase (ribokinase family)
VPVVPGKPLDVVCIGSAIVDVISHADESFLAEHDMAKGSMQLIDDDVVHALYDDMPPAVETSGGSAANTAAGIASFGGSVGFIGKVADDLLGEVFTHDIRAAGVAYDPVKVIDGLATARCLILVTADAERTMNTYLGVAGQIEPQDIDEATTTSAQVLYTEAYLWDAPAAKAALVKAMKHAADAGGKVAFSLSDSFCVDRHRAELLDLARTHVDILFGNEAEICALYETDSFDEAADRAAADVGIACLTRGAAGSVIVTGDERIVVAAEPIERLVDTTGAGDLYAAGFLFGYTNDHDLAASGRLASIAAAECIQHMGARPEIALEQLAKDV